MTRTRQRRSSLLPGIMSSTSIATHAIQIVPVLVGFAFMVPGLTTARAQHNGPPEVNTWMSAIKEFGFTTRAASGCAPLAEGTFFKRDSDRVRRTVWQTKLVNHPYCAFVDDRGRWVVTMQARCSTSHEHAVVVYGPTGNLLRDWTLEALLTADERQRLNAMIEPEGGCDLFRAGSQIVFADDSVWLALPWGRSIALHRR